MGKTLVLYVFYIYNDRVKHFINHCIFYDKNVDFIIISNDKTIQFESPEYTETIFRENIGFDFGGWSDALLQDIGTKKRYMDYDHFIFANGSIIGPYIHPDYKGKWTDIFIGGLQNNIKLFGSTINTCGDPINQSHVQSYIFSMDKLTLEYLIQCEIFTNKTYTQSMNETIFQKEILMSKKIIQNGWNIGSLLPYYHGVDFTFKSKAPHEYNIRFLHDVAFPQYRGILWDEYQLVFIKGNRIDICVENYPKIIINNNIK